MALLKDNISHEGFITTYHKISDVTLHHDMLTCIMDSYISREYRDLERSATRQFFNFDITLEEEESMGIRQLAYKKIKETKEWSDAIDC